MVRTNRGGMEKIHVNIPESVKTLATSKAMKEGRTITDVVISLLNEYVRKATEQEQIDDLTQRINQCEERLTALEKKEG